jgi:cell division protein FtsA
MREKFILGLDIGTTKVSAVVGKVSGRSVELAGMGLSVSNGMKKGMVVDIEAASEAVGKAVREAERSSGVELKAAYMGVAGGHIECIRSFGASGIKGKEISRKDIQRVMESASAMYVPLDREVIHVMPSGFTIDGQGGIARPVGMSGFRLQADVNVITASQAAVENLQRCCERAGLSVIDAVFGPIASCHATVGPEVLEAGVVVVDMGGGTSDIAVYMEGMLRHASVLPVGGKHFTNDIAVGLKVSHAEAERIKKQYGCVVACDDPSEEMDVTGFDQGRRKTPLRYLAEIVTPRSEELFRLIAREIEEARLPEPPSCVVLTGGVSLMKGADRMAEATLGLPVMIGVPQDRVEVCVGEELRDPIFSAGVGLVMYGMKKEKGTYDELLERALGGFRAIGKYMFTYSGVGWGFGSGKSHAH